MIAKTSSKIKQYLTGYPVVIGLGLVVSIWLVVVTTQENEMQALPEDEEFSYYNDVFMDALNYTREWYVEKEPTDYKTLYFGAIRGMLQSLGDHHTSFLDVNEMATLLGDVEGKFGGLGMHIGVEDDYPIVVSPIRGTPAYRAGLQPRDVIIEIEGEDTNKMALDLVIYKLKGVPGTAVTFKIQRRGLIKPKSVTITREEIVVPSVKGSIIEKGVGYIQLSRFDQHSYIDLKNYIGKLKKQGMKKLILDLRNNPGGLLVAAVNVANIFIRSGKLVYTRGRYSFGREDYFANASNAIWSREPLVILINEGSASASEIVAGAIQDTKRGILVGAKSYGKGSVQDIHTFESATRDQIGMRITVQKYYTPAGRSIHKKGIQPDIKVSRPEATIDDIYFIAKLFDGGYIDKYFGDKNGFNFTLKDVNNIQKLIEADEIKVNRNLLELQISRMVNRFNVDFLYDLEYDIQLKRALKKIRNMNK